MLKLSNPPDIDAIKPATECYKCFKLDLCCEVFEESNISGKCLRCNHPEHDHRLETGTSTRPFPLLLYPASKSKNDSSLSRNKPPGFSGHQEVITENTALRSELLNLQADLKAARSIIVSYL